MRFILLVVMALAFQSCTKETTIREIVPERKADPNIQNSVQVASSKNRLTIKKEALGKAFLFITNAKVSSRTPQWADFKPLVVSFEKSDSRLGLFKLTSDNLYSDIATDKLLQTFVITSEDASSVTVDLGNGFQSLVLQASLEIVVPEQFAERVAKEGQGLENSLEIKDTFLRSAAIQDNRVLIEQISRVKAESLVTKPKGPANPKEIVELQKNETTLNFIIEIRPYVENKSFKPALFDKEQRVGSFLNILFKAGSDLPDPQSIKWDLSPERGPITLAISDNVPIEVIQSLIESGEYWNRILGRPMFVAKTGYKAGDLPADRTMIIRWINWESAGFAYAGAQADPITGEIFRGQVFLTSSWYSYAKRLPASNENLDFGSYHMSFVDKAILQRTALCFMEQNNFRSNQISEFDFSGVPEQRKQKIALDTIRLVVTHEIGHAIGMRHNFAGSSTHPISDQQIMEASKTYLADENHPGIPLSSSIMDYVEGISSPMLGAYIKNKVLPFDQQFVSWTYLNLPITIEKYNYCSDEHIMMAVTNGKSVYGCDRFDSFKNPILGDLYKIRKDIFNRAKIRWLAFYRQIQGADNFNATPAELPLISINFTTTLSPLLSAALYKPDIVIFEPLVSIKNAVDSTMKVSYISVVDSELTEKLRSDLAEVGGLPGLIQSLAAQNNSKTVFQDQVVKLFAEINPADYPLLTAEQFNKVKETFMNEAIKADKIAMANVLNLLFPVQASVGYALPESIKEQVKDKTVQYFYRSSELGLTAESLPALFKIFRENILVRKAPQSAVVNDQPVELQFEDSANSIFKYSLAKYVSATSWPEPLRGNAELFAQEKLALKKELVKNTLSVLALANVQVAEITWIKLYEAINALDFTKIKGVTKEELQAEASFLVTVDSL